MTQPTGSNDATGSDPITPLIGPASETKSIYWEPYKAFSDTFRNWLIAYGIAIPYLFISEKGFTESVRNAAGMRSVVLLFLFGVLLQFLQVGVAKYVMMILYTGEEVKGFKNTSLFKHTNNFSERFWPYLLTDLGTVLLYAIGTWHLVAALITPQVVSNSSPMPSQAPAVVSQAKSSAPTASAGK